MITIYECTDCIFCISFGFGFRVACGNAQLPADEVYKYAPVEQTGDANDCDYFVEGNPTEYSEHDITKAVEMFGDDVASLRKWNEQKK